jgi:hypothetical protein
MAASTVVQQASPFSLTYNTATLPIGNEYAAGIGQAGSSIAAALGKVTDIMSQSNAANDQIDMFSRLKDAQGNPLMSPEDRDALMAKGLGARQAFVGELMGRFSESYKSQLAQQQAVALEQLKAQSALAQQQLANVGAVQATQARGAEERKTQQSQVISLDRSKLDQQEKEAAQAVLKKKMAAAAAQSQSGVLHQY